MNDRVVHNTSELRPYLVSERHFQATLSEYLKAKGWTVHYQRQTGHYGTDGRWRATSPKGWPDLFAVSPQQPDGMRRVLAIECKSMTGKLSDEQATWLQLLDAVPGITAVCWRPDSWDTIKRVVEG